MRPTRPLSLLLFSLAALAVPQSALGADAAAIVEAFDIPSDSVLEATTSGLYDQSVIAAQLGPIVAIDDDMALLTTGYASQVQTGVDHDLGTTGIDPTEPSSPVFDPALLELVLVVPDGMHSIQFDWYFLSREYPVYVGSDFNDRFTVIQTGALFDGNIVFDSGHNVVDVNNALFTVTDALSLDGTGFWRPGGDSDSGFDGGGTGWVTTSSPVEPGETLRLRFDVHDVADGIYDSGVLVDHFRWSTEEIDDPSSGAPVQLHWLSPKSAPASGGDTVLVVGRRFTPETRLWFGEVEIAPADIELVSDDALSVTVPPSPHGPGLIDVHAVGGEHSATLLGGFTWVDRSEGGTPPELISADPDFADASGGQTVLLSGAGLGEDTQIFFGDVAASEVVVVSSVSVAVTVPELEPGAVLLVARDPQGRSGGSGVAFVARSKRDDPADRYAPVPGGCDTSGSQAHPRAATWFLLVVAGAGLRRRRTGSRRPSSSASSRAAAVAAVVAVGLGLAGCTGDTGLRPGKHAFPVAVAHVVDDGDETSAMTVGVDEPVGLSGLDSRGYEGAVLRFDWRIVSAPVGSEAELEATSDGFATAALRPDVPGNYLVELVVTDHRGRSSHPSAVVIHASDGGSLRVRLDWQTDGHDLDLHLLDAEGTYFGDGDCFYGRPQPAWGDPELGEDDPRLLQDSDGTQGQLLREEIQLGLPAEGSYTVLVHHFNDRGSLSAAAPALRVWLDGTERTVPLPAGDLEHGEVWRALSIDTATGELSAIDSVTTHEELGGPVVNRPEHSEDEG